MIMIGKRFPWETPGAGERRAAWPYRHHCRRAQQMTGPDLPVEGLQVCSGTRTNRFDLDGLTEAHRLGQCREESWMRMSGCATGATGTRPCSAAARASCGCIRSGTVVLGRQQPSAQADQRGFGLGSEVSPVTVDRPAPVLGEPPECPIRVHGMGVADGLE